MQMVACGKVVKCRVRDFTHRKAATGYGCMTN